MSSTSRPRIVLDARPLSHPQVGGFRSYVRCLVRGLAEAAGSEEILLYLDRPLPPGAPPLPSNLQVRILDRSCLRSDFLLFRRQVRRDSPDLVHGTMNYLPPALGVPTTVTIHDALEIKRYPFVPVPATRRGRLLRGYSAALTRAAARRARRIVTVSAASAAEIAHALPRVGGKINVIHNGITLPLGGASPARSDDTILALASTDPRKNLDLLFRALSVEGAPRPGLEVVCANATARGYVEDAARRYQVSGVRFLPSLSDAEMAHRFAAAAIFVWPSRMEGFGLPPLEAMATGCPVVSSSAPSMPEVLGDVPLWFDPDHPGQLAGALATLLQDPRLRREVGQRGKAHAARFTCRRMAEQTLAVWRGVLA